MEVWMLLQMIGVTGWRFITTVAAIVHAIVQQKNQTAESVQSKISRPISKSDEKYMMLACSFIFGCYCLWMLAKLSIV
jgi:hypothetical protein